MSFGWTTAADDGYRYALLGGVELRLIAHDSRAYFVRLCGPLRSLCTDEYARAQSRRGGAAGPSAGSDHGEFQQFDAAQADYPTG